MARRVLVTKWLGIICVCFLCLNNAFASADKILLANGDWEPYQSRGLKNNGFGSQIVQEAFASVGVEVEFKFLPWNKGYEMAKDGRLHGTFFWEPDENRRKSFYYSDPVLQKGIVFFHLHDKPLNWKTVDELINYSICGVVGKSYGDHFDVAESVGRINVNWAASEIECFQRLLSGEIDIFPIDPEKGYSFLRNDFQPLDRYRVTYHPNFIPPSSSLHLLISKHAIDAKRYIDLFNKGLKNLKSTGKIKKYSMESRMGLYKKIK